jgi:uracil-DNA glycosylase
MSPHSKFGHFPKEAWSVEHFQENCQDCPLYRHATQTVFGEGPQNARGFARRTTGDNEDQAGRPFIGPAGQL